MQPNAAQASFFDAAPALFLDQFKELRMELSDQQLIAEAIETNHARVGKERTLDRYRDHLVHCSSPYLASVFGVTFYHAKRKPHPTPKAVPGPPSRSPRRSYP